MPELCGESELEAAEMRKRRKGPNIWYTIYAAHSDEVLAYGDPATCARMLGISTADVHSLVSNTRNGRLRCYAIVREDLNAHTCEIFGEGNRGRPKRKHKAHSSLLPAAGKKEGQP